MTNDFFTLADLIALGFNCSKCCDYNPNYQVDARELDLFAETRQCVCTIFVRTCPYAKIRETVSGFIYDPSDTFHPI